VELSRIIDAVEQLRPLRSASEHLGLRDIDYVDSELGLVVVDRGD